MVTKRRSDKIRVKGYSTYRKGYNVVVRPYTKNKTKGSKENKKERVVTQIYYLKDKKKRVITKIYYFGNKYTAKVFHPFAFEKGAYTVSIGKIGTSALDRNEYFTQVMAKSPSSALKEVINTPDFKRWKENLEKRIKEGKEKTGLIFKGYE